MQSKIFSYINQLNSFYRKLLPNNPISSNAQALYMFLLNKDSELGWICDFRIANSMIMALTGLSKGQLDRARNELIQKEYITYKKGTTREAGTYSIIDLCDTNVDTNIDTNVDTNVDTNTEPIIGTLIRHKTKDIDNKKSNTKVLQKNKQVSKFLKPSVEELNNYCLEQNLNVDCEYFYDYYESNGWKVSKSPMKDWKATLRNWHRRNNKERKDVNIQEKNATHEITELTLLNILTNEIYNARDIAEFERLVRTGEWKKYED